MVARNKILEYIGIPVGLALLLLMGGFWPTASLSQAGQAAGSNGAGSQGDIWGPGSATDVNPPWVEMRLQPPDAPKDYPFLRSLDEEPFTLTDSERAEMTTIESLQRDHIGFLTADALQEKMMFSWDGVVIDVGARSAYEHQHILGAINIPENRIGEWAPMVLPDNQMPIVTYCGSTECTASMSAARQLKALGYAEVYDFWGGLKSWVAMGLPTRGSEVAGK